jgi:hypothetical protein
MTKKQTARLIAAREPLAGPMRYTLRQRASDRWQGRADARHGVPAVDRTTIRTPFTLERHHELMDVCAAEDLQFTVDTKPLFAELAVLSRQIAALETRAGEAARRRDELVEPTNDQLTERAPGETHTDIGVVRRRRTQAHAQQRGALVAAHQTAAGELVDAQKRRSELIALIDKADRARLERQDRAAEWARRRTDRYARALLRCHKERAALQERLAELGADIAGVRRTTIDLAAWLTAVAPGQGHQAAVPNADLESPVLEGQPR